jgi:carboxypeptidase T
MKKLAVLTIIITVLSGAAYAETVYWTRAHADPARLASDLAAYDFDIAAAKSDHFDLIASADDLRVLDLNGVAYEILEVIDTTDAPPSEYTEYDEMVPILQGLAATYPDICALYDIGDSWESREIWALKISDNVTTHEADEKDILINGCHHAREIMTVEVPLYLATNLCEKYATDPEVQSIVDNVETWIIPMLNPDGHNYVFTVSTSWRKNRRDNGGGVYGVDPNRNYDYHWGESGASHSPSSSTYCGPYAFSEPEVQALRDLINDGDHQFLYALNYHSYGEYLLYPWAYAQGHPAEPDYTHYKDVAVYLLETLQGWEHGNDWECLHYLASGNAVDWDYDGTGHDKCYGMTFEIDTSFQPSAYQIPLTCAEQYTVLIKFLKLGYTEVPVRLTSFKAEAVAGGVALHWEVADQRELAGFNLYRRPAVEGMATDYAQLNDNLIVGRSPYTYVDGNPEAGRDYEYLLESVDSKGGTTTFGPIKGRAPGKTLPKVAALYQNWPNPARDATTFKFELAQAGPAALEVYDFAGRKVRTVFEGHADAGAMEIAWAVNDEAGKPLAPGIYVYRLRTNAQTLSKRLVVSR